VYGIERGAEFDVGVMAGTTCLTNEGLGVTGRNANFMTGTGAVIVSVWLWFTPCDAPRGPRQAHELFRHTQESQRETPCANKLPLLWK